MRTPLKRWTRVGVGIGAVIAGGALVFACNAVLGVRDFTKGVCNEGGKQCVTSTNTLQACVAGQWKDEEECTKQNKTCIDDSCTGDCAVENMRCADNMPQICNESGEWIDQDAGACDPPKHCQGGRCVRDCPPYDLACYGNTPQNCESGQWMPGTPCDHQTCLQGACKGYCAPGEGMCSGSTPQACNKEGEYEDQTACINAEVCSDGSCEGPSCKGLPRSCGPTGDESCCLSPVVLGGRFRRSNDFNAPAEVTDFRLDRFEITVGRFRRFVEAYPGSKPMPGAGAYPPMMTESGWQPEWDLVLPPDQAALRAAVNDPSCSGGSPTWTENQGANENLPMNCITWFEAFAFCAWDGGRLPTEAEWNYAAAGGREQREYPWSSPPDSMTIKGDHAVFDCSGPPPCVVMSLQKVGSRSMMGDGAWRQADLAGNVWEWNLDEYADYKDSTPDAGECVNCANAQFGSRRVIRGGSFRDLAPVLLSSTRTPRDPAQRGGDLGARCARPL